MSYMNVAGALVSPNDTTVTHNDHTLFGKLYCECFVILFSLDDNQISSEFFKTVWLPSFDRTNH